MITSANITSRQIRIDQLNIRVIVILLMLNKDVLVLDFFITVIPLGVPVVFIILTFKFT